MVEEVMTSDTTRREVRCCMLGEQEDEIRLEREKKKKNMEKVALALTLQC